MHSEALTLYYFFITAASAPTNLTAIQENSTFIRISWTPPTPLGNTTGYIIYYSGKINGSVNVSDGATNSHLLTGLQNGTSYTISIVGTSTHFFSEHVNYSHNVPLSELLQSYYEVHICTVVYPLSSRQAS